MTRWWFVIYFLLYFLRNRDCAVSKQSCRLRGFNETIHEYVLASSAVLRCHSCQHGFQFDAGHLARLCCSSSKASKSFTTYSIQLASDTPQDNAMLLRSSAALLWFGHHSYLERLYRPITQTVLLYCTSETTKSCVLYVIAALTGRKTSTKTFIKQTKCFLFDCRGACDFNWRLIKCLN